MTLTRLHDDLEIETENPFRMEKRMFIITSTKNDEASLNKCTFKLTKKIKLKNRRIQIKFKVLMTFDPDGSRLKVLLDSKIAKNYEFVTLLTRTRHGEWGNVNVVIEDDNIENVRGISLIFDTFHGDDAFQVRVKRLKIGD